MQAPRNQQKFSKQGLPHYDDLAIIFDNCNASGKLARSSFQGPLTSDEEQELEDNLMQHNVRGKHRYATNMSDIEAVLSERVQLSGKRKVGTGDDGSGSASKRSKSTDDVSGFLQIATEASRLQMEVDTACLQRIQRKLNGKD